MSLPKLLGILAVFLFGMICLIAFFKEKKIETNISKPNSLTPIEIDLEQDVRIIAPQKAVVKPVVQKGPSLPVKKISTQKRVTENQVTPQITAQVIPSVHTDLKQPSPSAKENALPEANRIEELFSVNGPQLPIVETVTYKSRVSWQKGRPAWLADYAKHYQTSRHFIARSLNGKPDYFKQDLTENARFNVLKREKNIQFYLLVDLSRCKMWLYYDDLDTHERVLLKTYPIGLGRVDGSKVSGFLTPIGKYTLGNKVAIYKPKMMGYHNGDHIEMITVFGTRWIPFDKEIAGCSAPAKGLGVHGLPWISSTEDKSSIGKYQSDGCVRLSSDNMEEIFAIIITKPTTIELVKDFYEAKQ